MKGSDLVSVLVSIVISLAVAHLLGGIGRIIRAPKVRLSFVHSAWIVFLLLECIAFWISQALTRTLDWTYPMVLRSFLASAALYLSCWLALPEETPKEAIDLNAFYDANRRKFLGAVVIYNVLIAINMMMTPGEASGSWTAWLGAIAAATAWFWPARAVQVLAVVVLLGVQTTFELQFIWTF